MIGTSKEIGLFCTEGIGLLRLHAASTQWAEPAGPTCRPGPPPQAPALNPESWMCWFFFDASAQQSPIFFSNPRNS